VELPPVEARMVTRTSDRIAEVQAALGRVVPLVAQVPPVVIERVRVRR
jgi:hypothetical protein